MKVNLPITNKQRDFTEEDRIISTTDRKGILTSINREFLEISGFTEDELIGTSHNIVRHPDMPPAAFGDLWSTVKQGESWMGIVKNRCKNGDHYWVDAFVTPIEDNGEVVEYQSVRWKPTQERVNRAEKVYARLNDGKKPFRKGLSFVQRLYASFAVAFVPVLLVAFLKPELMLAGVAVSIAVGLGLMHWQLTPMRSMLADSRERINNPLMQYIFTGRTDEFGQIMLDQKMTNSKLKAVASRLDFSSDKLFEYADKSADIAQASTQNVNNQRRSIQDMVTAITSMSEAVQQVSEGAQEMVDASREADHEADKGKAKVTATIRSIETLVNDISSTAEVINRLGEESKEIGGVLGVIRDIADQTNLLALNAAIEAARAGEQGRGFAVVADEVRSLAVRTQESITEIEEMISRVQSSAKEATGVMDASCEKAQDSSEQSKSISDFLEVITNAVNNITKRTIDIASTASEQAAVTQEIKGSVDSLGNEADQVVSVVSESDQVSRELTSLTHQLNKLVRQFS